MKNFFSPKERNKRIEKKIKRYYNAIDNQKIRGIIDKMDKNQQTLDIIEGELNKFIKDVPGNSNKEKWKSLLGSMKLAEKIIDKSEKD